LDCEQLVDILDDLAEAKELFHIHATPRR